MAVTQQIARLTASELDECRRDVETLNRLCGFKLRPPEDYLDLDWSPVSLRKAIGATIERACFGGAEINPAYRDHPETIWEHPVTALEPDAVREVAAQLVPVDGLDDYLAGHYAALRRFYTEAAERGLAAAMWWD